MSLARYVPRQLAEWEIDTSRPWRTIDGTLCYIDISGFTALSEKLARRGRIGAEELTDVLNRVFAEMLQIAYDRGGSLLKFGGDALLLLYRRSDHAQQACSAAVEMQAALRKAGGVRTSVGRLSLRMSVGIHSGTIHLFRVGDSHRELILTGPGASMTTEMEETATAGEILISSATKAALPPGSAPVAKGNGWLLRWRKARLECCGWSPRVALDPEAVAAGMPVALRAFLQYGKAEPEHRIATVGFIKYQGVDEIMRTGGPEAVAAALDDLIRTVQSAADAEGVTFLATDIDRDGGKIILVTGVPASQEDDEGRLLRAARQISDRAGAFALKIGINQGHVFAGEIGTAFRATYTVMGDTVNLAARLMAAASPGEIYATPATLDHSGTLFETTALQPFHVKGKAQPVQAYAVGHETGSRGRSEQTELPFVGRHDELLSLVGAVDRLLAGKGGAIAVYGETGIGKSRLVEEALRACSQAHVLHIRAEPYGVASPYRPLRDTIREVLGVERGDPAKMAEQLGAAVAELVPTLLPMVPLIADVAMVDVASTPEVDVIEPRFRQERTAEAVVDLLAATLTGPVVFAVDDGHWMDDASAHLLDRVVAATAEHPWLILATRRDDRGGFVPTARELRLEPLADEDAVELITSATAAAPLRPHDIKAIVQRAGGLPLFLVEIVKAVREVGSAGSLPDSLDAVVSTQIDALEPLPRRLLRYASVLGRSFRTEVLNELVADEAVELDAATRRQLAGFLESDGTGRLRFRHALFRDAAYEGLSFKRRKELHKRAGEVIERMVGPNADADADVLSLHFSLAGENDKTWRYARVAGDRAKARYANVEAAGQYARALGSAKGVHDAGDVEHARVWESLGDVQELAGLFEEALTAYRHASQVISHDALAVASLRVKRARARERAGQYRPALRETTAGLRLIEDLATTEAAAVRARLLALAASVRQAQQNPRKAVHLAQAAAEEATRAGERAALARAYSVLDLCYRWLGRPDKAIYAPQALAIYEELGDLSGQGVVFGNMGVEAYFGGRWDEAIRLYGRSRDAFHKTGNDIHAAAAESNMGEILVNQGKIAEAGPLLQQSLRVLQASGFTDGASFVEVQLGRVLAAQGDLQGAIGLLEKARSQFIHLGETTSVADLAVYLAGCRVQAGEPQIALDVLDEAARLAGEEAAVHSAAMLRMRALALAEFGRLGEAAETARIGLEEAEQQGLPYEIALLLMAEADLATRAGRPVNDEPLERARQIMSGLGVSPEATRTRV